MLKLPFAVLPTGAALLTSWLMGGPSEVHGLLRRIFRSGVRFWIYSCAILGFVALGFVTIFLRYFWDGYLPELSQFSSISQILVISPLLFAFPGFAEEFGWRGFMQDRLQKKHPVFFSSLLVGLIWGTWHTMDFLMGNWTGGLTFVSLFFSYIVGSSILIGALYAASGDSIFVAMLAHYGVNATNQFMPLWVDQAGMRTPVLFISLIWLTALATGLIGLFRLKKVEAAG